MKLLVQYFKTNNYQRDIEYLSCLKANAFNKHISGIYLFLENEHYPQISSEKFHFIKVEKRYTYNDFFEFANKNLENEICILANSDIIFDDTLHYLNDFDLTNFFLCLTRWEILSNGKIEFYNERCSQDSWIFKPKLPETFKCDRLLGTPGCDNFVSFAASRSGLITNNPSKLIITKHLHLSGFRTYDHREKPSGCVEHLFPNNSLNVVCKKEYMEI